jgi:hypothetical protein
MKVSPLAVHCTSLCCDLVQSGELIELTHADIEAFYKEVYELVQERTQLWPARYASEHQFIDAVALGVLKALHICKDTPSVRNANWILSAMQSRINFAIKHVR